MSTVVNWCILTLSTNGDDIRNECIETGERETLVEVSYLPIRYAASGPFKGGVYLCSP